MKTLVAGPYLGEFGCELFCWQAHLRWLSKQHDKTYVVCRKDHEVLYEDFAITDSLPYSSCASKWETPDIHMVHAHNSIPYGKKMSHAKLTKIGFYNQSFVKYGLSSAAEDCAENDVDVVIHARARGMVRPKDNWPEAHYEDLARRLIKKDFKVAFIGHPKASAFPRGLKGICDDRRGENLRSVIDTIASAKVVVGTSSGPMHLAALCGTALVVFSGPENYNRYKEHWNPFKVPVDFPPGDWRPVPEDAYRCVMKRLEK